LDCKGVFVRINQVCSGICLFAGLAFSCGKLPDTYQLEGLSSSPTADNVALLFETNVSAARRDVQRLTAALGDPNARYNYTTHSKYSATKANITAMVAEHASAVSSDGTLFLFMAGHGSPNGYLSTPSGFLNFDDIAAALRQTRTAAFRRLVVVVFSCYAGNWVDGPSPVRPDAKHLLATEVADQEMVKNISAAFNAGEFKTLDGAPLFSEMVVWASSHKTRQSWFSGNGSMFIEEFAREFASRSAARDAGEVPLMGEFIQAVEDATDRRTERPVHKITPEALLAEPLFN
jgi:hypothetical protein